MENWHQCFVPECFFDTVLFKKGSFKIVEMNVTEFQNQSMAIGAFLVRELEASARSAKSNER